MKQSYDLTDALEIIIETLSRLEVAMEPQDYRSLLDMIDEEVIVRTEAFDMAREMWVSA